jgi:toxin ParE1/3/4
MSANRVEYHQGAAADVRQALVWYQQRSPRVAVDFVDELNRVAEVIRKAPERWLIGSNDTHRFLLWRFPFTIIYSHRNDNQNLGCCTCKPTT